jgi:predicted HicB family RNase H-like nuclease
MDNITKKEHKIQVRMDNELHQKLSKEAQENERSLSGQVRYYILNGLKDNK